MLHYMCVHVYVFKRDCAFENTCVSFHEVGQSIDGPQGGLREL